MESRGLLERASRDADRRALELQLTKIGRKMYSVLVPLALERERALLSQLSKEELKGLLAGLTRLEEVLEI